MAWVLVEAAHPPSGNRPRAVGTVIRTAHADLAVLGRRRPTTRNRGCPPRVETESADATVRSQPATDRRRAWREVVAHPGRDRAHIRRGWEQMMFADPMEQFEPRAVMTLRRNESMDVPVAIRSPVSFAVSPSILRGWPRFDVPAWAARITSRAAMVDRAGYFDVPPGPHRLTLAIFVPEVEIAVARRSYFLDVPEPGESNGGFRLALGDSVF